MWTWAFCADGDFGDAEKKGQRGGRQILRWQDWWFGTRSVDPEASNQRRKGLADQTLMCDLANPLVHYFSWLTQGFASQCRAMTALTDAAKDEIQIAYRTWLAARDLSPDAVSGQMIAQPVRSLSADVDRIAVVEAVRAPANRAYCLAAIP